MCPRRLCAPPPAGSQVPSQLPLGRIGRPDDIAEVVSFLAGAARRVNGQKIYVNGGAV